jgi:hypothetical protein
MWFMAVDDYLLVLYNSSLDCPFSTLMLACCSYVLLAAWLLNLLYDTFPLPLFVLICKVVDVPLFGLPVVAFSCPLLFYALAMTLLKY